MACCGQAFADDKVTYSSDVHPTQIYSLKSFYDIDGDGILEVVGSNYNTNSFVSKVNGTKCKALSGIFNLFEYLNDNVGPLLLNKYGTNLWSYKDNQNYNVSDNQPITKFSVENNGFTSIFQDIPSTRTTNGKRVRDAAFFFIIMLVTFAATLLNPQKYVSSRTIQKCVEHVSTST